MNEFDMLVGFILCLGIIYGAIRGAVRQLTGILSFWLALVISLWLYRPFSTRILLGVFTDASPAIMDSFAFIILMLVFNVGILLVFILTSTSPEERHSKKKKKIEDMMDQSERGSFSTIMNAVGGLFMGFITTTLWLSISLALVQYILFSSSGLGEGIKASMVKSMLLPYFNQVLGYLYLSVKFFTPGELPSIFAALI
jgi:uncharacterized membrane protein required for colicin V production